jgi:hypothetical protein
MFMSTISRRIVTPKQFIRTSDLQSAQKSSKTRMIFRLRRAMFS